MIFKIILGILYIVIFIVSILKTIKYCTEEVPTYSDGFKLGLSRQKVFLHNIGMTYVLFYLLLSYYFKMPHSVRIVFYIFLINYIILLPNSSRLKNLSVDKSRLALIVSPLPILYLMYNINKINYAKEICILYFTIICLLPLKSDIKNLILNPLKNNKCPFN